MGGGAMGRVRVGSTTKPSLELGRSGVGREGVKLVWEARARRRVVKLGVVEVEVEVGWGG